MALKMRKMNLKIISVLGFAALTLVLGSCGLHTRGGELTGVPGRKPWYHPQPYGTIYVPPGSFHMGADDQDIANSNVARPKQVTVQAFYMDETEITNNEYRQYVYWVRDSMVADKLGDPYKVTDDNGND